MRYDLDARSICTSLVQRSPADSPGQFRSALARRVEVAGGRGGGTTGVNGAYCGSWCIAAYEVLVRSFIAAHPALRRTLPGVSGIFDCLGTKHRGLLRLITKTEA